MNDMLFSHYPILTAVSPLKNAVEFFIKQKFMIQRSLKGGIHQRAALVVGWRSLQLENETSSNVFLSKKDVAKTF